MLSTMQDFPLTVTSLYRRGRDLFGSSQVVSFQGATSRRATFTEVSDRAERLAAALKRLGIREGDRVGTFCWNNQEHQEAYLGVPSMGAVLHTLNLRLTPEQLAFVVNHAEDRVIIVDGSLVPILARAAGQLRTVEHLVVTGGCRSAGRSSRRCRGPASASTTRGLCAPCTRRAGSRRRSSRALGTAAERRSRSARDGPDG